MLGDYIRTAAGLVPIAAVLAAVPLGVAGVIVTSGLAALFAVFGIRTALRHGTRLEITRSALRASGLVRATVPWSELDRMNLAYYSTRRDGRAGWMQLELRSRRARLRIDSRIDGFVELVRASARAAETRGLSFNAPTSVNLEALGVKRHALEPDWERAAGGAE